VVTRATHRTMGLLLILAVAWGAGCDDPCPDGSMLDSLGGLVAVEEEHPESWGTPADCTACHAIPALHRSGCTEGLDGDALRAQVLDEGEDSCRSCHGDLGTDSP